MSEKPAGPTRMHSFIEGIRVRKSQFDQLNQSNEELKGQVFALQEKLDSMTKQSQERDALIESMKAYLDTHDEVDVSTIASHLANINSLVEQLANEMTFKWQPPAKKSRVDHSSEMYKGMKPILGRLARALDECDIHDEASRSLLLYSFQCVLAVRVFEMFQSRTFRTVDHPIQQLSQKIREGEIQPVYGRWRSLTQRYLRVGAGSENETDAMNRFSHAACIDIYNVALIFGFGLPSEAYTKIIQDLQSPLEDIAKRTIHLSDMVTTDVVSKDYELLAPVSGAFDSSSMDVAFPLSSQPQGDKVVCAISLGLVFVEKPGRQQVAPQRQLVQKAMVITENTINEIKNPIAKTDKKHKQPQL